MKNRKRYIIILLCFAIWGIIFAYIVNNENLNNKKNTTQYVLIDQFNYWKRVNSKWEKLDSITNYDDVSNEINWKKYDIYVNNQYYDTLDYVLKDYQEYYFDDETHSHEISQEKILLNEETYLSLKNFNLIELSEEDFDIISKMLSKYNHPSDNLTIQDKYFIDDNNSVYIISNYQNYDSKNNSNLFYTIFYRSNNKNYLILNEDNVTDINSYKLSWILNAKNKFDNFILSYTCEESTCYDMYEYQKGKFVKVIGTLTS